VVGPRTAPEDTGGLGGLFGEPARVTRQLDQPVPPQPATPSGTTGWSGSSGWDGGWDTPAAQAAEAPPPEPTGSRRRAALLVAAALVLVVVLGVGGWLLLPGGNADGGGTSPSASTSAAAPRAAANPTAGETVQVDGVTYTMQAGRVDDSCADHAYGSVAGFFAGRDCAGLSRALWSAEVAGQPAVVSLSRVVMPDEATAQALITLTDGDGTGNVSDLLREGVSYAGSPDGLRNAQYASSRAASSVTIVEASWAAAGPGTTADLDRVAGNALTLPAADVPGTAGD
jgi:hypothetical protein